MSGWRAEPAAGKGALGIYWWGGKTRFQSFVEQDYNVVSPSPATLNSGLNPTSAWGGRGRGEGDGGLLGISRSRRPRLDAA